MGVEVESMTREELKAHCKRQIEICEMWAKHNGNEPSGKIYEEHKLILELLEQEPFINKPCVSSGVCEHDKNEVLDKIREEIKVMTSNRGFLSCSVDYIHEKIDNVFDKYKSESRDKE